MTDKKLYEYLQDGVSPVIGRQISTDRAISFGLAAVAVGIVLGCRHIARAISEGRVNEIDTTISDG